MGQRDCGEPSVMRKTAEIAIEGSGRDAGKVFRLTEMSATRAEDWGMRAVMAMTRAGNGLEDGILSLGMAAVARVGIKAFFSMQFVEAKPLMDELMACVQIKPDRSKPFFRDLIEDDIEDPMTRLRLKSDVLELHTGFSVAAALLAGMVPVARADTENMSTSPSQSGESSPLA
jgi:hypothetical protein